MNCSFTPDGKWFVFDDTGKTLAKNFPTKQSAIVWMGDRLRANQQQQREKDV